MSPAAQILVTVNWSPPSPKPWPVRRKSALRSMWAPLVPALTWMRWFCLGRRSKTWRSEAGIRADSLRRSSSSSPTSPATIHLWLEPFTVSASPKLWSTSVLADQASLPAHSSERSRRMAVKIWDCMTLPKRSSAPRFVWRAAANWSGGRLPSRLISPLVWLTCRLRRLQMSVTVWARSFKFWAWMPSVRPALRRFWRCSMMQSKKAARLPVKAWADWAARLSPSAKTRCLRMQSATEALCSKNSKPWPVFVRWVSIWSPSPARSMPAPSPPSSPTKWQLEWSTTKQLRCD